VLAELDDALASVRVARPDIHIERPQPRLFSVGLNTSPDSEIVRVARAACDVADIDSRPIGVPYGTDASILQAQRGIASIVLGPGSITQAHGADEFVSLDQLVKAVDVYEGIALRFGES
jgi:acetylornithine deacetylase